MQIAGNRVIGRFLCTMIFAAFLILIVSAPGAKAFDAIEVIDVDTYAKEIPVGQTQTYNWTVYNPDSTQTFDITVSIFNTESDWAVSADPVSFAVLPQDAVAVTLTVTAPLEKSSRLTNATVTFTVKLNGATMQFEERYTISSLPKEVKEEEQKIAGLFSNPLPSPFDKEGGVFLLTVAFWAGFSFLLVFIMDPCVKWATKKTKTQIDDIILKIVRTPLLVLVFFYGFTDSLVILEDHIPEVIIDLVKSIYGVAAVLIIFYVVYKLFKDILVYYGQQIAEKTHSNIDNVIVPIVEKIGVMIIGLLALGYMLGYLNVDLTMFVAGGVVVSMVIAFAAQETLSNFFSGIFILTDRPFKEEDTIILPDGDWYEVRDIGLRSTRLYRYKDSCLITIPNNKLANEKIVNYSNPYDKVRFRKTIGVAYGTDVDKTRKILKEILESHPHIITDDEDLNPIIRFDGLGESSIDFFIQVHVDDRSNKMEVVDYLNTEIYRRFAEEGIEIPYPQRVVHIQKD